MSLMRRWTSLAAILGLLTAAPIIKGLTRVQHGRSHLRGARAVGSPARMSAQARPVHMVWFTGRGDLRTHDHPGLHRVAEADALCLPVFVLDNRLHCGRQETCLRRLHAAIVDLDKEIKSLSGGRGLHFCGGAADDALVALARRSKATTCHVVSDSVETGVMEVVEATTAALQAAGVEVCGWSNELRPGACGSQTGSQLPRTYAEYRREIRHVPVQEPLPPPASLDVAEFGKPEPIPSAGTCLERSMQHSKDAARVAQIRSAFVTTEPYDHVISTWAGERAALGALQEYMALGRDAFADKYFGEALLPALDDEEPEATYLEDEEEDLALAATPARMEVEAEEGGEDGVAVAVAERRLASASVLPLAPPSLHAAGQQWLIADLPIANGAAANGATDSKPRLPTVGSRLALREAATRALTPALTLGSLSPRRVYHEARNYSRAHAAELGPARTTLEGQSWGRSDLGALVDVVEWRDWYALLAANEIRAAKGAAKSVDFGAEAQGAPRALPEYRYWRWGAGYLTRYAFWDSDESGEAHGDAPDLLFVHGFGASAEQWCRLAYSLREQFKAAGQRVPRMYAIDLIGFGHSEKPGITLTQHVWEAHLADFVTEMMAARPFVVVGNSIGGGLSAGLASNLKEICKGLVLCNTAGRLIEPNEYVREMEEASQRTVTKRTLGIRDDPRGLPPYPPLPFGGQPLLDAFGYVLISYLRPQVKGLLRQYYPTVPDNADDKLAVSIGRDGSDPGAPNVIASGQKLPPQRPLNELLCTEDGFPGPVLVPQGALDPLTGPERSQSRAKLLASLRSDVTVRLLDAGHCPHDEVPHLVAQEIVSWWPNVA